MSASEMPAEADDDGAMVDGALAAAVAGMAGLTFLSTDTLGY